MIVARLFSVFLTCLHLGYSVAAMMLGQTEVMMRVGALTFISLLLQRYRAYLIDWLELPLQLVVFLWVIGSFYDLYEQVWWYDEVTHFVGPAMMCVYALSAFRKLLPVHTPQWFYVFSVFNLIVMLTVVWEFYEYYFARHMLTTFEMDLGDTISDLLLGFIGAGLVSVRYYWRLVKKPQTVPAALSPSASLQYS